MKKIFFTVVLMVSLAYPISAQQQQLPQFLDKVSPYDLANSEHLIRYYYNIPSSILFSDLPEKRMKQLLTAVDKQCESAYHINTIYVANPNSATLKKAMIEGIVVVPGRRLMDFTKVLKRYNELK